jgi:hypothetical protein
VLFIVYKIKERDAKGDSHEDLLILYFEIES